MTPEKDNYIIHATEQIRRTIRRKGARMNEKLAAWAGRRITPTQSGKGCGRTNSDALITVTKSTEGGKSRILRFSLHARAVKQLGWIIKDRIAMDVTKNGDIVLHRSTSTDGRALSQSTSGRKVNGSRKYVRFAVVSEFYDAIETGDGRCVEIKDGAIAFGVGKEGAE